MIASKYVSPNHPERLRLRAKGSTTLRATGKGTPFNVIYSKKATNRNTPSTTVVPNMYSTKYSVNTEKSLNSNTAMFMLHSV
jgi:hypothetical protein